VPGLESRSVVVDADADRVICGAVSDLGGGGIDVSLSWSARSRRTSSSDEVSGGTSAGECRSRRVIGGRGLVVGRDAVRLGCDSSDDPRDRSTSTDGRSSC